MSEKETFELPEEEYRMLKFFAKKQGLDIDKVATVAIVQFLSNTLGGSIKPEDTEEFLDRLTEETKKNPDLDVTEFLRNFKPSAPVLKIETVEVKVKIPKKLLAFLKDKRKADLKEYLSNCVTDTISADIEAEVFGDPDQIKTEYDLKAEFEAYRGH